MATQVRFLALGDSYTVGESLPAVEGWPAQLVERFPHHTVEVTVIAKTGWTTGELLDALGREPPGGGFDLVSVQIGVNDQYRSLPVGDFTANAGLLLDLAHRNWRGDRGGVLAVSIPDWGVTPYAADRNRSVVAAEIDEFNAAWEAVVATAGAAFVDVTSISRLHPGLVVDDGLHPSQEQYRLWVDAIAPVISSFLTVPTD